jgi:hypothetical protein
MIGYVDVQEQVDKDFHRALLKASLRRWRARLRRECTHDDHLLSFDEAKGTLTRWTQGYLGMRTVEVEKITGSVGRYRDFDGSFSPLKKCMVERWGRIDRAYHRGDELPAVSLYKIGDRYFVRDGNHRVSVARYHGVAVIDAEVVEIRGHARTNGAQPTPRVAGNPTRGRQHPPEPRVFWLRNLWRRLRPGLLQPEAEPVG